MIQKTIRAWGEVPYTNAEADELTQELNDRTVYGTSGYNSIAELGAKMAAVEGVNSTQDTAIGLNTAKLSGIEAGADVTDTANVTAAGALMDSEVTNLAQVKAFDSADYATVAQGTLADGAAQLAGDNVFTGFNRYTFTNTYYGNVATALLTAARVLNSQGNVDVQVETDGAGTIASANDLNLKSGSGTAIKSTTSSIADIDATGDFALTTKQYNDSRYGAIADVTANTAITDVAIVSDTTSAGGGTAITNMVEITQAAYDLLTPDASTFYLING
jgi:hypothetical protein